MRTVTFILAPAGRDFDAGGRVLHEHGVTREAIHDIRTLDDGSAIMQMEVSCRPRQVREVLDRDDAGVYDYQLTAGHGGSSLLQIHYQPRGVHADLIELHQQHAVVIDYPIDFVDPATSAVRMVEVGRVDALRQLIDEMRDLACVTIEEVGTYDPAENRAFGGLTTRQQQVLRTALERGYYDVPRDVTYEDIAHDLDCSASTVGQHLRRIEAKVLSQITPTNDVTEPPEQPAH